MALDTTQQGSLNHFFLLSQPHSTRTHDLTETREGLKLVHVRFDEKIEIDSELYSHVLIELTTGLSSPIIAKANTINKLWDDARIWWHDNYGQHISLDTEE